MIRAQRPHPGETAETFISRVIGDAQHAERQRIIARLRERGTADREIVEALRELQAYHETLAADALARLDALGPMPVEIAH